jgi:hypothetical protein
VIAGGTLNYGLGSTLPLLIGFLLLPVYTAFLTPEDYGIVEMVAVIGALLTVFMRLGVPGAVTRYYYEHSEGPELRDYVTSVAWFLRVSAFIVGMLALVVGHFFLDVGLALHELLCPLSNSRTYGIAVFDLGLHSRVNLLYGDEVVVVDHIIDGLFRDASYDFRNCFFYLSHGF